MTLPLDVDEVQLCPYERQTLRVDHACVGDSSVPCEGRRDGRVCGTCSSCVAAQSADPRYTGETP